MIFIQNKNGDFVQYPLPVDSGYEDLGCLLFDADNDGDNDLYIVSGGNGHGPESEKYQDRLYINDGRGNFSPSVNSLPDIRFSGSVITACDFDRDGDLDLFRGSRVIPSQYPYSPKSYLLENKDGIFSDVSDKIPGLDSLGMITSALWTDYDNDGFADLIVTGE